MTQTNKSGASEPIQSEKQTINNPIEMLLVTIEEIAIEKAKTCTIKASNPFFMDLPSEADKSSKRNGVFELNGKTYEYEVLKGETLMIRVVLNGVFETVQKVQAYPNNKSQNYGEALIIVKVRKETGVLTVPFELDYKAKSGVVNFKEALNRASNDLIFEGSEKTLTSIRTLLNEKCNETIYCLANSGAIFFDDLEGRIYQNAYTDGVNTYVADENNIIELPTKQKVTLNTKLGNQLPILDNDTCTDKDISTLTFELLDSIKTAFNGKIEPFLALGLGIMGSYADKIWSDTIGFPVGYLYGASKQGKSTIENITSYIYGFDTKFLAMGCSTTKSVDRKTNLYNNCVIPFDDISSNALRREFFENLIVAINECKVREKMKNGNEFNILPICSPIILSSNYLPIQKEKMLNRMLPIFFERNVYKPEAMAQYYENPTYLSRILPQMLSMNDWQSVKGTITKHDTKLAQKFETSRSRESHNVAVAYTGLLLLEELCGFKLENQYEKLCDYYEWYLQQFQELEEPIDAFLNHLLELLEFGTIRVEEDISIDKEDKTGIVIKLRTQTCLDKFNSYIGRLYPEKFIQGKEFMVSAKNSTYFIKNKNVRFKVPKGKHITPVAKSLFLNISDHPLSSEIYTEILKIESDKKAREEAERQRQEDERCARFVP